MREINHGLAASPTLVVVGNEDRSDRTPGDGLVAALRAGSRTAMAELFSQHLEVIYNFCFRRTGSWSAAEDLSATVFLEVWRSRRRVLEVDGSALPWIYGVAANVCRNHLRSQRRGAFALTRMPPPQQSHHDHDVVEHLDADRRAAQLIARLNELPPADSDVFVLVCWEQLSYAKAALALDIPIGTVRSRLARVRRILRLTDQQENADV